MVEVEGINHNVTTSKQGEFWRLLVGPKRYRFRVHAYGFKSTEWEDVDVAEEGNRKIRVRQKKKTCLRRDISRGIFFFQFLLPVSQSVRLERIDSVEGLDELAATNRKADSFGSESPYGPTQSSTLRPDGFYRKPEFQYHHYDDLKCVRTRSLCVH